MKDEHTNVFVEWTGEDGRVAARREWGFMDIEDAAIINGMMRQLTSMEIRGATSAAQDFRAAIQKVLYDTYTKWVLSDD